MSLTFVAAADNIALAAILNKTAQNQDLVLRLYTNNPAEANDSLTQTGLTEASGAGYSAISINAAAWSISGGTASYPQQTFTFTGDLGADVYGYYFTRASGGELMWYEKFSNGPYNPTNNGDQIKVTPTISLE